jgi:DNA-binding phage protein
MIGIETKWWDAAAHLGGAEAVPTYLEAAFEEDDARSDRGWRTI